MVIGLYGINGLYNYGCEAIVRGTTAFLKNLYPDCKIVYYSRNPQDDRKCIADLEIEVKDSRRKLSIFQRVVNKVFRICFHHNYYSEDNHPQICREIDMLCSIGGDIYTIPKYLLNQDNPVIYSDLVEFGKRVLRKGKKVMVYGASIGPFGDNPKVVTYFSEHFKEMNLILCRENETKEYLKKIGVESNVMLFPDPAYSVVRKEERKDEIKKEFIGINISPLSLYEIYGQVTSKTKLQFAELLDSCVSTQGMKLLFIPHVLSKDNLQDNDYEFMKEIQSLMKQREKTVLVKPEGFREVKQFFDMCSCVVAARMHCCVNALCEGIPTIFLAYSSKAIGMSEFVYGNKKWLIPLEDVERDLNNKIEDMIEQKEILSIQIHNRIHAIKQETLNSTTREKIIRILE